MKYFVLFVFASAILYVTINGHGHGGGHSSTYRKQEDNGHYSFGYHIKDKKGATNFRKEHGDGWNVKGSYGLYDKDGRMRVVHYVADKNGFRAVIKTNEPGTGNVDSANAIYNGPDYHGHSYTSVDSGSNGGDSWDKDPWSKPVKKHEDHWNKKHENEY